MSNNLQSVRGMNDMLPQDADFWRFFEDTVRARERVKDGPNPDDVAAAQSRVDAARASVELGMVTAPFAGTVTFVEVKPGDIVTMGSRAFGLADLTQLFVDVDIPEVWTCWKPCPSSPAISTSSDPMTLRPRAAPISSFSLQGCRENPA